MHADITRDTFDPARHFSRVLMQQGRVPLDADLNEQTSILLHYLRTLAVDLMGPHAGPRNGAGFKIGWTGNEFVQVGDGHYYVYGILCEKEWDSPDIPLWQTIPTAPGTTTEAEKKQAAGALKTPFLVYLEVWEQLVTAYHQPLLRETALGGPDTAARAQVMWRIRTLPLSGEQLPQGSTSWDCAAAARVLAERMEGGDPGGLAVRAGGAQTDTADPCVLPPDALFRGMENQLYRVEIHTDGQVGPGAGQPAPTFKWSRENGSVVFAIRRLQGVEAEVETLGLDPRLDLSPGDWVEITDDERASGQGGMLARVLDVNREELRVTLEDTDADYPEYDESHAPIHPLLRRWDQSDPVIVRGESGGGASRETLVDGAVEAVEGWIELESGISVRFEAGRDYRAGDYWLIPARVATGNVEWPEGDAGGPATVPARRTERYYAPLGLVTGVNAVSDCRRCIGNLVGNCGLGAQRIDNKAEAAKIDNSQA